MSDAQDIISSNLQTNSLQEYIEMINTGEGYEANQAANNNESDESLISIEEEEDSYSILDIISSSAINLVLPFINGLMLGFGEIVAHEIGFKYGWYGAKVEPKQRMLRGRLQIEQAIARASRGSEQESKWL
ncbi:Mim1 protein [Saccharomycopsis crataegensis]|uniref:Mim1 protein n=1 Tax=Saccharomycopsis crataegensis TaxID=43959 RepID=A0AAV5QIT5_9ASCO|nr:Mim1 protein [Saccharomycopsis crataegensis]